MDLASDHERILQVNPIHLSQRVSAPSRPPDLRGLQAGAAGTFVSVELCSTPSKVLRFAPTPLARGLRTLTASARSSRPWLLRAGRVCVLACSRTFVMTSVMTELDDGSGRRYSEITSLMPHGIPFTSPDVKR